MTDIQPIQAIQPTERVDITQHVDQVRRRIAAIEEKIGINSGDFQATLEREIARQAALHAVNPAQSVPEAQKLPGSTRPVNENEAANAAKIAEALRDGETKPTAPQTAQPKTHVPGEEALPGRIHQPRQTPQIGRVDVPDVEPATPNRDEKVFEDNYFGEDAELTPTEDLIMQTAYEYGVDPQLVKAIATAESNLDQSAISPVGAIGVMQLMPETAEGLGVNPYDEAENIVGGTKYIRQMLETFDGNVPLAVAAYNAGPAAVKRYGGIPPYAETRNYVGRVMDMYQ